MFRNGLSAGRRSLASSLSSIALSPRRQQELPFVCHFCRARALTVTTKHKRTRGTRDETLLGDIKRLELHVQHMERNFKDIVKKQAATAELPGGEITEEDKDKAYAALMAPDTPAAFLPTPKTVADLLPPLALQRLSGSLHLVHSKEPQWGEILTGLEQNGGLFAMTTKHVNDLVELIDVEQRADNNIKVFEMMNRAEIKPDTYTYDLFMLAHSEVGNSEATKQLFKDLQEKGLVPTVYSYGHLLKAYSEKGEVQPASAAFQEMNALGIQPNLIVYTTLLKTCIVGREFNTAWQIFNLMKLRSKATAPDTQAYTLMIHAAALEGEVERALDLYTDMVVRQELILTPETYHALIHACAMRKDYFSQAWKFVLDMQSKGMKIEHITLNTLMHACAKVGELTRARLLVRHMMGSGFEHAAPDAITFQHLFRVYATCNPVDTPNMALKNNNNQKNYPPTFITPDRRLRRRDEDDTTAKDPRGDELPFLKKTSLSHIEIIDEASAILAWMREKRPHLISSQLLNAYLNVCKNQGDHRKLKRSYYRYFSSSNPNPNPDPDPDPDNHEYGHEHRHSPRPPRNVYTFASALEFALRSRDLPFARQIWRDRQDHLLALKKLPRHHRDLEKYPPLTPKEAHNLNFTAEKMYIEILAKCGFLGEASKRFMMLQGMYEWKREDTKTLWTVAVQREDWRTIEMLRERFRERGSERWEEEERGRRW